MVCRKSKLLLLPGIGLAQQDIYGLPKTTVIFAERLLVFGLDIEQIHGAFVLMGFLVGVPQDQEGAKFSPEVSAAMNSTPDTYMNR